MSARFPPVDPGAPLVVFDFDHTLYDGDSGSHLFRWLIERVWWRRLLALLVAPVAGPMIAWLPTRRAGISSFVWVGTVGLHRRRDLDALIDRYVAGHVDEIRSRLLPVALEVLHRLCHAQLVFGVRRERRRRLERGGRASAVEQADRAWHWGRAAEELQRGRR